MATTTYTKPVLLLQVRALRAIAEERGEPWTPRILRRCNEWATNAYIAERITWAQRRLGFAA